MFSPYYAIARALGRGDPLNHCTINVSLWHRDRYFWGFTERNRNSVTRTENRLHIGTSGLHWDGNALNIDIDELNWPRMNRVRGRLRLIPTALTDRCVMLDSVGWHRWWPVAPHARLEADLQSPSVRWSGDAYFDHNAGQAPLEQSFSSWTWSRARLRDRTAIFYDLKKRHQEDLSVALIAGSDGSLEEMASPPGTVVLPKTRFRLPRSTHADAGTEPAVKKTIEDGPFYARSQLTADIHGERADVMQETLSLDRLTPKWIRYFVMYRSPRDWFGRHTHDLQP